MRIRYEELVARPEAVLRILCEKIELNYEPDMLNYYNRADQRLAELNDLRAPLGSNVVSRAERIEIHQSTKKPPTTERIGVWRDALTPDEAGVFKEIAGPLLTDLGYEP